MLATEELKELSERILAAPRKGRRLIVAIVGAPASGKSTLAENLAEYLNARKIKSQVVPMDGFHLENDVLMERGLLARKGAPETFDLDGFHDLLQRISEGKAETYPMFDRQHDTSVADAGRLYPETDVVIIEGNYLLLDEEGWRDLKQFWDFSVMLKTPLNVLRERLIARWLHHGLGEDSAAKRAESNDIPNAERVVAGSSRATIILNSDHMVSDSGTGGEM